MMKTILKWLTRGSEFIAAMSLAVIFTIFLLQIFTRYAPNLAWMMPLQSLADWMSALQPIGCTVNLISLMWVWIIFFGCAFFVRERDHVAFDIVYNAVPRGARRVLALSSALIVIAVMAYSFGPTWDAIMGSRLMELKKIQTLSVPFTGDKIPVKWLFASYILLMIAVMVRYAWRIYAVLRFGPTEDSHEQLLEELSEEGTKS
jgi:C4-dicarboxylate transporter DctQ subunit